PRPSAVRGRISGRHELKWPHANTPRIARTRRYALPEGAIEAAHRILSGMQVWPPAPPPNVQEMRKRMEERRLEMMRRQKPGTIAGFTGSGGYDPSKGTESSTFNYWDGDTFVQETLRNHKGHELKVVER